jgi:predicted nucleotidyltransferase component of viral defense system
VCRAVAIKSGLPLQFVVKEFHVFGILSQITAETSEREDFVFKGGTALNKAYLAGVQRFSEDLDFDLQAGSMGELWEFCRSLSGRIGGYRMREMRRVRKTVQFYCEYDSQLGGIDHVRVDVSLKKIIVSAPLAHPPIKSDYAGLLVSGIATYALEDLVARKLNALRERGEGKDFYDAYAALPKCGRMKLPVEKMLESEGQKEGFSEFVEDCILKVQKSDARKLRALTNPFIPASIRPRDWRTLKEELVIILGRKLPDSE